MNDWISANNARPDFGDRVFVNYIGCTDSGLVYKGLDVTTYHTQSPKDPWAYGGASVVTHWLHLPASPIRNIDQ